jgi:hypothetical protein
MKDNRPVERRCGEHRRDKGAGRTIGGIWLSACALAGVKPTLTKYEEMASAMTCSKDVNRRHLTKGQKGRCLSR